MKLAMLGMIAVFSRVAIIATMRREARFGPYDPVTPGGPGWRPSL